MTTTTRFPEFDVSGLPRELGRQIGEAAREQIQGFCEIALQRVNLTTRISRESALAIASASIPWAEQYAPDHVEELRGTAEAAGVTLEDLMLLQVRNQLQPDTEGCTSFSLSHVEGLGRVVAQNWDSDPALTDFTVVLTRRPTGKPACTTITQAGLIAYIGYNTEGIGLCLNTLPAPSRKLGVPHYFQVREILAASSLVEVLHAVQRAERAIPANIMLTTPQGPANLEITIDNIHVTRDEGTGLCLHTNHACHPELVPLNTQYPELIQSYSRLTRIEELLPQPSHGLCTLTTVQKSLRDHMGHPRSICRHPNDDPRHGFWQTVFSVIIAPETRSMWITRGTPCDHPFEQYKLV